LPRQYLPTLSCVVSAWVPANGAAASSSRTRIPPRQESARASTTSLQARSFPSSRYLLRVTPAGQSRGPGVTCAQRPGSPRPRIWAGEHQTVQGQRVSSDVPKIRAALCPVSIRHLPVDRALTPSRVENTLQHW